MKKILSFIVFGVLVFTLAGCTDTPTEKTCEDNEVLVDGECVLKETPVIIGLAATTNDDEMTEGDTGEINVTTNDEQGVTFESMDTTIVSVTTEGVVTAVGPGSTSIKVTSRTDTTKVVTLDFTIAKLITLTANDTEITLKEEETATVNYDSNDTVSFSSTNQDIFVVDSEGNITAKSFGTAYLVIKSDVDNTKEVSVKIIVRKKITLDITTENVVFVVGDQIITTYESNDEVTFDTSDVGIVSVSPTGVINAVSAGTATITATSVYDPEISDSFEVTVLNYTETLEITGTNLINIGMSTDLDVIVLPENAFDEVTWSSANETVATVDENGVVTAHSKGTASIIVTSTLDNSIVDTFEIEVLNIVVVDGSKTTGDTLTYLDVELEYGINLFGDIDSAIDVSEPDSVIYVFAGTYNNPFTVDVAGLTILTEQDAVIGGSITLNANNISIEGFTFNNDGSISNSTLIENFTFVNNEINTLNNLSKPFLHINGVKGFIAQNNTFDSALNDFILVEDFMDGEVLIEKNVISNADLAIRVLAISDYAITSSIKVIRNEINNTNGAIEIDKMVDGVEKDILSYARFNSVESYAVYAAKSSVGNTVDFTLNYWGTDSLDDAKFIEVSEALRRGYYETKLSITPEAAIKDDVPIIIEVSNPIDEMMIGDTHALVYTVLPLEMNTNKIKFITSNPDVLGTDKYGNLLAKRSGNATITIRSSIDFGINATVTVKVTTTPGIELSTDHVENDILVGDTFTLTANPFPLDIENAAVTFSSSDDLIATIDANGLVTATGAGLVFLTASLADDPSVTMTYSLNVYASLDENNLLDYLSMHQVGYATPHEYTVFGFQYNFADARYESVSRYYFDDIPINQEKMVPVSYGIRPGELMDVLPEGTTFNDDNIHWVVVHDTASTATGSGALAHANYLYNAALGGTALWTSWHYTIDDTYIYQHLPEVERGYHAGDGSTNPGTGTYFGGGNRNGVGIEMSVNDDGDMYRTWQRTAKLVVDILVRNDLPRTQMAYHNDFSGKDCPNTLRNAGLIPLFEIFTDVEYKVRTEFPDAEITFASNDLEYLDNTGRIIKMPDRALTVSYTITVTDQGVTSSRTFYTYLPGTVK